MQSYILFVSDIIMNDICLMFLIGCRSFYKIKLQPIYFDTLWHIKITIKINIYYYKIEIYLVGLKDHKLFVFGFL